MKEKGIWNNPSKGILLTLIFIQFCLCQSESAGARSVGTRAPPSASTTRTSSCAASRCRAGCGRTRRSPSAGSPRPSPRRRWSGRWCLGGSHSPSPPTFQSQTHRQHGKYLYHSIQTPKIIISLKSSHMMKEVKTDFKHSFNKFE